MLVINRWIKNIIPSFEIIVHRVSSSGQYVIFENGRKSNYLPWLTDTFTGADIGFVELQLRFIPRLRGIKNIDIIKSSKVLFLHSAGEVLQRKLIMNLLNAGRRPTLVGFQHGLVGTSLPRALNYILRRTVVDIFLCQEKTFEEAVKYHIGDKTVLLKEGEIEKSSITNINGTCDVYFDAPDKQSIISYALRLQKLQKQNKIKISKLHFHPSTRLFTRWFVSQILPTLAVCREANKAIVWDSKVKFEIFDQGMELYTITDASEIKSLVLTNKYADLSYSIRSFIKNDLKSYLPTRRMP